MFRIVAVALLLGGCATAPLPAPKVETQTVYLDRPVACLAPAGEKALLAKIPPALTAELPLDVRDREPVYIARLAQYRIFSDAIRAILPKCAAPPVSPIPAPTTGDQP